MASQVGVKTLKGRDFLSLHDFSPEEIRILLKTAEDLKTRLRAGEPCRVLAGKTLGMIFHKPSTRTRVSFEVGMVQLGGHALMLRGDELQLRRGETIADTARVLSRFVDGVMIRTFSHQDVVELAEHASVPVINGLTDLLHPCQGLTDLLTIEEKKGRLAGLKLAYVGDGNNVCHSLLFAAAKTGMHIAVAAPDGYQPRPEILELARGDARSTGARIEVGTDPVAAVAGADVVYTDAWASMGQEAEHEQRVKVFAPYQVNAALLAHARADAIFMHDLPAHRGEEVTDEVMDGPQSVVFDQAENRLHAQKAILALLL
ncbi:MAG: ornithine carbamoyltransferase [Acetobacteraceae bacterium]|nr:ornithine carbamoyltransferase [Acetobacteraceae bacterium]